MSQFVYLLNALEAATHDDAPADVGYAEKRQAVLEYVAKLERAVSETRTIREERLESALRCCEAVLGLRVNLVRRKSDGKPLIDIVREALNG